MTSLRASGVVALGLSAALAAGVPATASAAPTTTPATRARVVVLGSAVFAAPVGKGWGTPHPREIYNGGDPSGDVHGITWSRWGSGTAVGNGLTYIFQPQGGYYPQPVRVQLWATSLGRCTRSGPLAYRRLYVRGPEKPGGPLGPWFLWSDAHTLCTSPFV